MTDKRTHPAPVVVRWVLIAVLLVAIGSTVWIGTRAMAAADHLRSAEGIARELPAAATADAARVPELLTELQQHTAGARASTSDLVWAAGETLPWVGPQLRAVSALAESADTLARGAAPALGSIMGADGITALTPKDGVVPLDAIAEVGRALPPAVAASAEADAALAEVDDNTLLRPVREQFQRARSAIYDVGTTLAALDNATRLLPPMLGADGPRDYLIAFQNNAELRSLGGMPGSYVHLHAEGGRIELRGQYSAGEFRGPVEGVLDADARALYGGAERVISATTSVPDFAVSGELIREYWRATRGAELDGVIAVDPVAISYLLEATGPVALPGGETLDAGNAVPKLLNEVYARFDPVGQNAYFAAATGAVFGALMAGDYAPATLLTALGRAADERRLLIYSAHEPEQEIIGETSLAGALPGPHQIGVFLNDGTGSKMDYFLEADATVAATGARTSTLTVTLRSTAPSDAATLAPSITGAGSFGVPAGTIRTVVYVYLPQGHAMGEVEAGTFSAFTRSGHAGREVLATYVDLAPGESATATIPLSGPATPDVIMTPQAR